MESEYVDSMHGDAVHRNAGHGIAPEPMAYTVPEAADALRLSERQVWNLVGAGTIESITIGRSRRITRAALTAYIDSLRGVA